MSEPNSWWAVLALVITTAGGVLTAWLGRGRREEVPLSEPEAPELAGANLSTLEGIAVVVSRQSRKITTLESHQQHTDRKLAAHGRYMRTLQQVIRSLGAPVPDPDPEDAPLIRQ